MKLWKRFLSTLKYGLLEKAFNQKFFNWKNKIENNTFIFPYKVISLFPFDQKFIILELAILSIRVLAF